MCSSLAAFMIQVEVYSNNVATLYEMPSQATFVNTIAIYV